MKIKLMVVGKTSKGWVRDALDVYIGRLSHYVNFSLVEIPDIKGAASLTPAQIKTREAEAILSNVKESDTLILLDEHGREWTSIEYSKVLEKHLLRGKDMIFAVGGAYGFDPSVHARADEELSLSRMTFSHQMVRVFFTEQLYRAFTILKGEPYHNE